MTGEPTIQRVDLALIRMRRLMESSTVRRKFYARLGAPVDHSTIVVLRAILAESADEPASVGDVAHRLMVDASTASRLVDQVVKAGYVERSNCDTDRRRTRLEVTADGDALLNNAAAIRTEMISEWVADWPGDDLHQLADLLERYIDSIIAVERT